MICSSEHCPVCRRNPTCANSVRLVLRIVVPWGIMCAYIQGSGHTVVLCVTRASCSAPVCSHTSVHTLMNAHSLVRYILCNCIVTLHAIGNPFMSNICIFFFSSPSDLHCFPCAMYNPLPNLFICYCWEFMLWHCDSDSIVWNGTGFLIDGLERCRRMWLWCNLEYLPSIWLNTPILWWQNYHSFSLYYNNYILSRVTNIHKICMVVNVFHGLKVIACQNVTTTCSLVDTYKCLEEPAVCILE